MKKQEKESLIKKVRYWNQLISIWDAPVDGLELSSRAYNQLMHPRVNIGYKRTIGDLIHSINEDPSPIFDFIGQKSVKEIFSAIDRYFENIKNISDQPPSYLNVIKSLDKFYSMILYAKRIDHKTHKELASIIDRSCSRIQQLVNIAYHNVFFKIGIIFNKVHSSRVIKPPWKKRIYESSINYSNLPWDSFDSSLKEYYPLGIDYNKFKKAFEEKKSK